MQTTQSLLQEIQQLKKKLDALRPFDKTQLKNLQEWFRIGFVQNTNAIEWNTMTLSEVKVLLEDGITVWGKTIREIRETINHDKVLEQFPNLFETNKKIKINEKLVLLLHMLLMKDNLPIENCGKRRKINIIISGSTDILPNPSQIPKLMWDFFTKTCKNIKSLENVARVHYDFVKIHPFVDGNGRIARFLMNLWLIWLWYFPIIIPVVIRKEYISSLKWENFDKRLEFFLRQVKENNKDYLRFFSNS